MAIKDLQIRQGKVDITVEVVDISEPREFEKFGKKGKVASAKVKDATGEITLSLWNDQVDLVKPGQTLKIINGYVSEFQGDPQLTTGKFGKLEIIEGETKEAEESGEPLYMNKDAEEEKKKIEEDFSEEPVFDEENIEEE